MVLMSSLSVPGFEILETLRQTSKSVVLKAVQHSLDRTVVLVFLKPERVANPNEVRQFLGVARICSQLKAQGLPQIYDIVSDGERHYVVMEFVEGPSLAGLVSQHGPMAPMQAVRVAFTIAEALEHVWQQSRLVHRNLKPSEVRIDARGTPKLTDFGRATVIPADGLPPEDEDAGMIVGTPNFLAPEQIQAKAALDCRTDMYALGAVLYYMVTGRVPFPDDDPETIVRRQITDQIPHPRNLRPDLPATVGGLIARLMMKRPDARYPNWIEAMGDMQRILKGQPLRRRETPLQGISTVADFVVAAPAGSLRVKPGAAPADRVAAASRSARQSRGVSHVLRGALWMVLGLWFALLAVDRLGYKLPPPFVRPLLPLDDWERALKNACFTPAPAPAPAAPVTAPVPSIDHPMPVQPAANAVVAAPPSAPIVAPSSTPESKPALPRALPPDCATRLAACLLKGDLDGARALLTADVPMDPAVLAEFRAAIGAVQDPRRLAEQTLLKSRGTETTISYLGKERRIIPRSVANGEIQADFVSADGNRPVTFKTDRLTPEEVLKLMPTDSDSPAIHVSICVALLRANRRDELAQHVSACGVLTPVIEAAAKQ